MCLTYRHLLALNLALTALTACKPLPAEPGATESSSGTQSSTDDPSSTTGESPTSTGDTSTGTGGLPVECDTPDPAVSAAFAVELPDWPADVTLPLFEFVTCTIDQVTPTANTVTTAFTCDVEGTPRPVVATIAAAPEGDVIWLPGEMVRLSHADFIGEGKTRQLIIRRPDDDALLVLGIDWGNGDALEGQVTPLTVDIDFPCDPGGGESYAPTRLRFALPGDQAEVAIFSGHRDVLPIDGDNQYVIDVAEAGGNDLHPEDRVHFLLRWTDVAG
jgi:hypothetical protein